MEKTISYAISTIKESLDKMETDANAEIANARNAAETISALWKYLRPILEITDTLEKADMLKNRIRTQGE